MHHISSPWDVCTWFSPYACCRIRKALHGTSFYWHLSHIDLVWKMSYGCQWSIVLLRFGNRECYNILVFVNHAMRPRCPNEMQNIEQQDDDAGSTIINVTIVPPTVVDTNMPLYLIGIRYWNLSVVTSGVWRKTTPTTINQKFFFLTQYKKR